MSRQQRWRRNRQAKRGGYTLVELMISSSVGAILVAGLSGSLYIASQSFDQSNSEVDQSAAQEILGGLMLDLNQAIRFTERTAAVVTFTVPDRTGDGLTETIRYAWGGVAGDPLTYEYNGSAAVTLASGVQNFDLSFLTRIVAGADVTAPPTNAAVVFEEFTEQKEGSGDTATAINTPLGTSEGDLLIAVVVVDGNDTISPPGGWNEISMGVSGNRVAVGVWWKMASSSEPTSHAFTWNDTEQFFGWIMRFTGHDPSNPIADSDSEDGTSSSPTSPEITTSIDNTMILRIGGFDDDDVTVGNTGLNGHQTIVMDENKNGGGTVSGGSGYVIQASAGDSGETNFSLTNSEEWWTVTIGIAPAP